MEVGCKFGMPCRTRPGPSTSSINHKAFLDVMQDDELRGLFEAHVKGEFSPEGVMLWQEAKNWKVGFS